METERNWNGEGSNLEESSTARTMKDRAAKQAREAKQQMRSLADAGREEVANQLEGFAHAFEAAGETLRSEEQGAAGQYTEIIGEQARNASRYLRERDADALIYETESFARRNPLVFMGGCLLAGFAIGRFLNASPERSDVPRGTFEEGSDYGGTGAGRAIVPRSETVPVQTAPVRPIGPPNPPVPPAPTTGGPTGSNGGGSR